MTIESTIRGQTIAKAFAIDGLPQIPLSKKDKLVSVLIKIISQVFPLDAENVEMPFGEDGTSKGFVFVNAPSADIVRTVVTRLDGYKMDKSHILAIMPMSDIPIYADAPETFVPPQIEPYQPKEHLKSWLSDSMARDQFVTIKSDEVSIFWNGVTPEPVHSRPNWSESFVKWSPKGSYLATMHRQGIALWGGKSWSKINRFSHPNVTRIDFSPNETYVVTWSSEPVMTEGHEHHLFVWEVASGRKLRSFPKDAIVADESKAQWPFFKWSHDDTYIAKFTSGPNGMISVYEIATMSLLEKKSIKIADVQDISWSPTENVIAYWTPESGNIPARVTLIQIPNRNVIRTKNLFNILELKMYWQNGGEYLLCKILRQKTKKQIVTNFEVFRMKEKDIPVDSVECEAQEPMGEVFWEPHGDKFAVVATEMQRNYVYMYVMEKQGKKLSDVTGICLIEKMERKGINTVAWSPKGRFCVFAGIKPAQGDLEFWDMDNKLLMGTNEHYMATDVQWDASGRYVASSVSYWQVQSDTGYVIWNMNGQMVSRLAFPIFKQFLWRPRPATLLSKEEQKKIEKNLKQYAKEFDDLDTVRTTKASKQVVDRRVELWNEWMAFRKTAFNNTTAQTEERVELYGFDPFAENVEEFEEIEEVIEEVLEETIEIVE